MEIPELYQLLMQRSRLLSQFSRKSSRIVIQGGKPGTDAGTAGVADTTDMMDAARAEDTAETAGLTEPWRMDLVDRILWANRAAIFCTHLACLWYSGNSGLRRGPQFVSAFTDKPCKLTGTTWPGSNGIATAW